jgi:dienelactone hydrolase
VHVLSETTEQGVTERAFTLVVGGEPVPGILWLPAGAEGPRPVVLVGHGGTQHKRVPNIVSLARRLVRHQGYAVAAIDAPGHGDRITDPEAAEAMRQRLGARLAGGGAAAPSSPRAMVMTPDQARQWQSRTTRGVDEWKAVLEDLLATGVADGRFGYWGVSMGTAIGLPFVASEPRIGAAVLGLSGLSDRPGRDGFAAAARSLSAPVLFLFQWDDELMTRQSGLDLFDAIGSADKTMHVNPGGHVGIPVFERAAVEAFYVRVLGPVGAPVT